MADIAYGKDLAARTTPIPGLLVFDLVVHGDNRGWFKENWQREKMLALGLPDLGPVQNNISFNDSVGVTRGLHAEPWDKFISIAAGRVFGAWVDLREGPSFGATFTCEIDPSIAVYVPRGVANGFQTLEPGTAYTYLVNDHWSPEAQYTFVNLADPTVGIEWPIPLERAETSDKDKAHPALADVVAMRPPARRVLVTGANGQLGRELASALPAAGFEVVGVDLPETDISRPADVAALDWNRIDVVINAAAWTNVDGAETAEGRPLAWAANASGPALLARRCAERGVPLVHISSEYVFDGTRSPHREDENPSPLGVYGQAKAGGDAAVTALERHYLVRTSWVVGDGKNFVRTMMSLADKGVSPTVVDDQVGRLTFTRDLAAAIVHLLTTDAPFGTYNVSGEGEPMSWQQVAATVFELCGRDPADVGATSTAAYFAGKQAAPRPLDSVLDLTKIEATGFTPADARERLRAYVSAERG